MTLKILVFSRSDNLSQSLCECLDNQYEIIHCRHMEKNILMPSMLRVSLFIIEAIRFTRESSIMIQKIREKTKAPVLFLSGTNSLKIRNDEKVQAIEDGVDEYLSLPQSIDEITASVKALLRWNLRIAGCHSVWEFQEFKMLLESRQVLLNGKEIPLTKIEFDIVQYLAYQDGRAVTYKELYEQVWKRKYILDDMSIMGHIHRLRKKLEPDPKNPVYIQNVYGIGYRFGKKIFQESWETYEGSVKIK